MHPFPEFRLVPIRRDGRGLSFFTSCPFYGLVWDIIEARRKGIWLVFTMLVTFWHYLDRNLAIKVLCSPSARIQSPFFGFVVVSSRR